jgi:hypothetical protein
MSDHKHKCELVRTDANDMAFEETLDSRIEEWPHSWPDGDITYRLNNFTPDIAKQHWQTKAVTVALRAWQFKISKLKFRRERNPDVAVDFDISFEDLDHFDGRRGVFAHAYYPGQGQLSGDVHINDDWEWVAASKFQMLSKPPLVPILIHEFGHSLGLKHDPYDNTDIMYPSFDLGKVKNLIGYRSTRRMQDKYGTRNLSSWIQDYFNNRRLRGSDFR